MILPGLLPCYTFFFLSFGHLLLCCHISLAVLETGLGLKATMSKGLSLYIYSMYYIYMYVCTHKLGLEPQISWWSSLDLDTLQSS